MCCVKNEAVVDEKLTHLRPVVVLETLNLARYATPHEIYTELVLQICSTY